MNTQELCQVLAETLRKVRANEISPKMANAVASAAKEITRARRLQLDYNGVRGNNKPIEGLE